MKEGQVIFSMNQDCIVLKVYTTNNPQLIYNKRVQVYCTKTGVITSFAITE